MKATIIGLGKVGSAIAFSLANSELFEEMHFIDIDVNKAEGEALDISHALGNGTSITSGEYDGAAGSDFVYITAGFPRKEGQLREELYKTNKEIVEGVIRQVLPLCPDSVYIIATNPVDIMVRTALDSGLNRKKTVGLGSLVDTYRFRDLLSRAHGVNKGEVECMVIGEHGKNMIPLLSQTKIKGQPREVDDSVMDQLTNMGAHLNWTKGGASHAVGNAALEKTRLFLEGGVCPASVYLDGEYGITDATIGVPALLGKGRIRKVVELELSEHELKKLRQGAEHLKNWNCTKKALIEA